MYFKYNLYHFTIRMLFAIKCRERNTMAISFSEPERLTNIFDAENREEWQKTSHIIRELQLSSDMTIADVGAGTGYFSNIFSQTLCNGKVYSIDCEPNMVTYLQDRFSHDSFHNVQVIQSVMQDPCIPADVDIVFVANTYRFITDRGTFLSNLFQQIQDHTQVIFVDFKGSNARVTTEMATNEVQQAGFEVSSLDIIGCPDHYILAFKRGK